MASWKNGHDNKDFYYSWDDLKSDRMKSFLQDYIAFLRDHGNPSMEELIGIYERAGYAAKEGSARHGIYCNVQKIIRKAWPLYETDIGIRVKGYSHRAFNTIVGIMNDTSNKPEVRLKAAQDILTRAGVEAPKRIEIESKDVTEKSTEELTEELSLVLTQFGVNMLSEEGNEALEQGN